MKKITLALLGAALLMSFVSCGSKPKDESATTPAAPEEAVEETVEQDEVPAVTPATDEDDSAALESVKAAYEKALASKAKIDEWELAEYDQNRYNEAGKLLEEVKALLDDASTDPAVLEEKLNTINGKYNQVLVVGFKKLAKEYRESAYESKGMADSVKAGVAEKDRYKAAVANFKEGDTLYAMQATEKAIDRYISADDEFYSMYEELKEKRAAALAAIEAAKKAVAEVEVLAAEADITDPVTEDTEGIEKEDTVLLEEDTYENPDDAVEEVPATMTEAVIETATDAAAELNNLVGGDK